MFLKNYSADYLSLIWIIHKVSWNWNETMVTKEISPERSDQNTQYITSQHLPAAAPFHTPSNPSHRFAYLKICASTLTNIYCNIIVLSRKFYGRFTWKVRLIFWDLIKNCWFFLIVRKITCFNFNESYHYYYYSDRLMLNIQRCKVSIIFHRNA